MFILSIVKTHIFLGKGLTYPHPSFSLVHYGWWDKSKGDIAIKVDLLHTHDMRHEFQRKRAKTSVRMTWSACKKPPPPYVKLGNRRVFLFDLDWCPHHYRLLCHTAAFASAVPNIDTLSLPF